MQEVLETTDDDGKAEIFSSLSNKTFNDSYFDVNEEGEYGIVEIQQTREEGSKIEEITSRVNLNGQVNTEGVKKDDTVLQQSEKIVIGEHQMAKDIQLIEKIGRNGQPEKINVPLSNEILATMHKQIQQVPVGQVQQDTMLRKDQFPISGYGQCLNDQ